MASTSHLETPVWDRLPESEFALKVLRGRTAPHENQVMASKMDVRLLIAECKSIMDLSEERRLQVSGILLQAFKDKMPEGTVHAAKQYPDGNCAVQFKDTDLGRNACLQALTDMSHITLKAAQCGLPTEHPDLMVKITRHKHDCAPGAVKVVISPLPDSATIAVAEAGRILMGSCNEYRDKLDLREAVTDAFHPPLKAQPAMGDGSRLAFFVVPPNNDQGLDFLPRSFQWNAGGLTVHVNVYSTLQASMKANRGATQHQGQHTRPAVQSLRQLQKASPEIRAAHAAATTTLDDLHAKRRRQEDRSGLERGQKTGHGMAVRQRTEGGGLGGNVHAPSSHLPTVPVAGPSPMDIDTDTDIELPLPPAAGPGGKPSQRASPSLPTGPVSISDCTAALPPPAPYLPPPPPPPPRPRPPPPPPPPPRVSSALLACQTKGIAVKAATVSGKEPTVTAKAKGLPPPPSAQAARGADSMDVDPSLPSTSGGQRQTSSSVLSAGIKEWLRDSYPELPDEDTVVAAATAILVQIGTDHPKQLSTLVATGMELKMADIPISFQKTARAYMAASGCPSSSYDSEISEAEVDNPDAKDGWKMVGKQKKKKPGSHPPATANSGRVALPPKPQAGRQQPARLARETEAKSIHYSTRTGSLSQTILCPPLDHNQTPAPGRNRRGRR